MYASAPTLGWTGRLNGGSIDVSCKLSASGGFGEREKDLSAKIHASKEKQMNVTPFLRQEIFGPDETKAMSIALDEVCSKLGLTDDKHEEKAALAKRIIALARNGERDPAVLRDGVLRELAVTAWGV